MSQLHQFKESELAHQYLDGLKGIEIGGSWWNPFGLDVVYSDLNPMGYHEEKHGKSLPIEIVCAGDDIPVPDKSFDFVINSHVLEHFYDPIRALLEWKRIARKYIFLIIPHKERIFDRDRICTSVNELILRHKEDVKEYEDRHWNVWTPSKFMELMDYMGFNVVEMQERDDKVGNGFTVVIKL